MRTKAGSGARRKDEDGPSPSSAGTSGNARGSGATSSAATSTGSGVNSNNSSSRPGSSGHARSSGSHTLPSGSSNSGVGGGSSRRDSTDRGSSRANASAHSTSRGERAPSAGISGHGLSTSSTAAGSGGCGGNYNQHAHAGMGGASSASYEQFYTDPPPAFRDVSSSEKQTVFVKKLHLCSVCFDFTDSTKHVREKEVKRQTLLELVDYVNHGSGKFTESVFPDVVYMLASNLFRALPPSSHELTGSSSPENFDPEEDEPQLDPAWEHLQIVYEFLLRFVVSGDTEAKQAKRYIDQAFVSKLLELFDSEDPRERDYLKTIVHRIYGKFMVHRPFIRKAINNIFFRFIYETERHNGIAELLEILGSIINGFALPLKDEHKTFLSKALMPLHKPKTVAMYHQQLSYCVTQFVEKDPKLADTIIRGLLKYWPATNSQKEVLFLGELEEVLELTQNAEFVRVSQPLFKQLAKSIQSSHFQVAERALFLWNNDYVASLIAQNKRLVLPYIYAALERNDKEHWNVAVHQLTGNVRKMFQEIDKELWNECARKHEEEEREERERQRRREQVWKRIDANGSAAFA